MSMETKFRAEYAEKNPNMVKRASVALLIVFLASVCIFTFATGSAKGIGFLMIWLTGVPLLMFGACALASIKEIEYTIDNEKVSSRPIAANAIGQAIMDMGAFKARMITPSSSARVYFRDVKGVDEKDFNGRQALVLIYEHGLRTPYHNRFTVFLPEGEEAKIAKSIKSRIKA